MYAFAHGIKALILLTLACLATTIMLTESGLVQAALGFSPSQERATTSSKSLEQPALSRNKKEAEDDDDDKRDDPAGAAARFRRRC